jgi:hypothetical protein
MPACRNCAPPAGLPHIKHSDHIKLHQSPASCSPAVAQAELLQHGYMTKPKCNWCVKGAKWCKHRSVSSCSLTDAVTTTTTDACNATLHCSYVCWTSADAVWQTCKSWCLQQHTLTCIQLRHFQNVQTASTDCQQLEQREASA